MIIKYGEFIKYTIMTETKLVDVFDEYPDSNELIWQFVGDHDFNHLRYGTELLPITELATPEFIKNFEDNAAPWQKKYVNKMSKNINPKKVKPIIITKLEPDRYNPTERYMVVDGNHRLMALYKAGIKEVSVIVI